MARALMLTGGGFLLAVLWFDLKFDTLAWELMRSGEPLSEASLAIIRSYYERAAASEMSGFPLIISMMGLAVLGSGLQLRDPVLPLWPKIAAPALVIPPVLLAGTRVVPNARLLGAGELPLVEQSDLAVLILQDHLYCFSSILVLLLVQLYLAWRY